LYWRSDPEAGITSKAHNTLQPHAGLDDGVKLSLLGSTPNGLRKGAVRVFGRSAAPIVETN